MSVTKQITARIDERIYKALAEQATANKRSLSNEVAWLLEDLLSHKIEPPARTFSPYDPNDRTGTPIPPPIPGR